MTKEEESEIECNTKCTIDDRTIYERGMKALRDHREEVCVRVMKSRSENKGNFEYLKGDDYVREHLLSQNLERLLYRLYCKINNNNRRGCCDNLCSECEHPRYNFHSVRAPDHWCNESPERWYCQEECECK